VKKTLYLFCIIPILTSCGFYKKSTYNPNKKFGAIELKEDFSLLHEILQKNHPSLYWYTAEDSINHYFKATEQSLHDSLTEQQFKNKVAWTIAKIRCGHTTVRSSKEFAEYITKKRLPQFPAFLKVWKDSAIITNILLKEDSVLKRGTPVTAINGFSSKQVIDSICNLMGTDGYADVFKYQAISFNFPAYYRNAFGIDSQYVINYVDTAGLPKSVTLKNYIPAPDTGQRRRPVEASVPLTRKQLRELRINNLRNIKVDTINNTAILSVNTFSGGKLIRFFNKSFRQINKQGIKNVVVDLRLNSGGSVLDCTRLSQYLVDKPFVVADTVAAISRRFEGKNYIKPWFIYWLGMHFSGRKQSDGKIHFGYFENHTYHPRKKNHFGGAIYLLTSGYTFSAATLVTNNLKGQKNVTIVGEETGGGSYGNSAMFLPTIILPNTGIRVTLPLFRIVFSSENPKTGRGIFPDVEVGPSSIYIKEGIDAKLMKVMELIKMKQSL
jgi:hypothetical protein